MKFEKKGYKSRSRNFGLLFAILVFTAVSHGALQNPSLLFRRSLSFEIFRPSIPALLKTNAKAS